MQLTVLKWIGEKSVRVLGRVIESIFRTILFLLPLGVYMLLLQRRKASSITSISVYTNERSQFQHVFPGFILVSVEPESLSKFLTKVHNDFQSWVQRNKYALAFLFMSIIVTLMVLTYIRGGI